MKYSEANQGRTFVIRLEDGEIVHEEIERFAKEHAVKAASIIVLGGADKGSRIVAGPEDGRVSPINPMEYALDNVYEASGVGTLFPDDEGNPITHIHMSFGRKDTAVMGCIRSGVKVWQVMEVILQELTDTDSKRLLNKELGFKLLEPKG
jgi:predicted DNA-binding protein with PD1-like motif